MEHKNMKLFPRDCPKECPHFRMWDLSIDDYVFACTKLNLQIDGCDIFHSFLPFCPLEEEENDTNI